MVTLSVDHNVPCSDNSVIIFRTSVGISTAYLKGSVVADQIRFT